MCIGCLYRDDLPDANRDYRSISTDIALTDIRNEREVVAVFEWREADPWAVAMNFGDQWAWTIDRELLKDGLHRDGGLGDVQFCGDVLHPNRRLMILDSPDGRAVFRFDPIEVAFFVDAIDRQVRFSAEKTS